MWRKEMRQIVDALKNKLNFKHDSQIASAVGLSKQHMYLAVKEDRLNPDRILQFCLNYNIDITRLLRDGKAVSTADLEYSDSAIELSQYVEGSVVPTSKKTIPKWFADLIFRRNVNLNETQALLVVESDEMEPKIQRDSILFLDRSSTTPQGGHFYLNVNGYGVIRRLMKANHENKWYLLTSDSERIYNDPLEFEKDFSVIGRIQFVSQRI